ncbi:hypothetical protein H4R35_004324 [Dimargaris xerosporica]|nr:hypothetical protein H4R35_004324 [Dimargaris xerosporica]
MPFFASLAYAGKVAIAERLLQYFKRWGYVPNITNYSILINGLYHTDQPADRAIALFEAMIQQGIAPDYSSYYSIIRFCAFRGLMPQALVLYEQMIVRGLEPGSNIHAVIATAYLRQGRSDDAQRFVRKVGTVRSELDRLAMNTLWATIFQVTRSTTSKQQLVSLFRQMLRSGVYPHKVHLAHLRLSPFAILDIMQQENIPVQGRTLTAFMYRAFKARDFRQAMQLLEYMKQHNIVASNYFYNAFIEAFVYAGQMSPAFSLYDDMVKNEIRPNHITYKALISGVARAGNLDGAYKLLDIMTANRILPDLYMYNTILTHCARLGRHEAALKLYRRLKQETLIPDEITYECVIAALCRQRLFDKTLTSTAEQVWEFYKQLKADQITPSHAIFQLVLPVLCRSDQFDHAWTVWSDMRALNLLPTTAICNYMMVLCEKHQDTDKVLSIWALMIAKGVLRDPISFKVYLSCCHRANLPTQVIEDVHRQLAQKDANIKVSAQNLIQLATILAHRGQWEDLLKLVRQWGDFGLLMESNHLKTLLNMAQAHGSSKQVDAAIVQIVHDQYPESLL